jgi:UDP:flavonoid glycosyltransferase YjiC (YdhE family)
MEGVLAPLIPLAKSLARRGHEVVVATGPDLSDRVRAHDLEARVAGPSAQEAVGLAFGDPVLAEGDEPWRLGATMFARIMAPQKLPQLQELIEEFHPDLVLQAPVDLAAPLAAATRGVRAITYGTGLVLETALIGTMAQWVAPMWHAEGLPFDPYAGIYRDGYLDPVPTSLQPDLGAAGAVARAVRPEVPGSQHDILPEWAAALGHRPLVYVSLGTVPIFNQLSTFTLLLDGLAALDVDAVVSVGLNNEPSLLPALPERVHVEQWVSLAALLPLCDAVICHAGAGTTLAALSCGLPLVLAPRGADQFPTAAACRAAGAALVLDPSELEPDVVLAAVRTVLDDGIYRRAAQALQQEIAVMPSADSVVADLECLVSSRL